MKLITSLGIAFVGIVIVGGLFFMKAKNQQAQQVLNDNQYAAVTPQASPGTSAYVQQAPVDSSAPGIMAPSTTPVPVDVTISIDDNGFTPSTVTVNPGAKVTFMNNGQAPHWPASDPHPSHTGLPGFDAKKGLATGESYSFVFDKVGVWGFHDHLNARNKGSVAVADLVY